MAIFVAVFANLPRDVLIENSSSLYLFWRPLGILLIINDDQNSGSARSLRFSLNVSTRVFEVLVKLSFTLRSSTHTAKCKSRKRRIKFAGFAWITQSKFWLQNFCFRSITRMSFRISDSEASDTQMPVATFDMQ